MNPSVGLLCSLFFALLGRHRNSLYKRRVTLKVLSPSTIQDDVRPVIENGLDLPSRHTQAYDPHMTICSYVPWAMERIPFHAISMR
jgi:hypothetical protein